MEALTTGRSVGGLYYEVSGEGAPVVLIHAFSVDHRMWDRQVADLDSAFRVIRYDLRGHGRSAAPDAPFAAHEDLAALLDELGIARTALVGLSAGARIAVDFALTHPERVSRLVLAAPGVGGYQPRERFAWMDPVIVAARSGDAERAAELWAATPLMAIPHDSAAQALVREMVVDNAHLWRMTSNPERPLTPPALERLSEIRVPVLVLVGEHDLASTHEVVEILARSISGAQVQVVPGAGHLLNLAAPRPFSSALLRFLRMPPQW